MNYLQIVTTCIGLLFTCSLIFALVIEAVKKLMTEETIKKTFGSLENFSLLVSTILGLVVYVIYLVFFIIGKMDISNLDIAKLIIIGLVFIFSCGLGSQVGYDKVIKVLKEIFIKE